MSTTGTRRARRSFGKVRELPSGKFQASYMGPGLVCGTKGHLVPRPQLRSIVIAPHPHEIVDGRRHYAIRAIPYQDPEMEAARLKAVQRPGSRSSPGFERNINRRVGADRVPRIF